MTTETFDTPGDGSWLCPAGVTSVQVKGWGGGVVGMDGDVSLGGVGGGAGGYFNKNSYSVTPGNTYNYHVSDAVVSDSTWWVDSGVYGAQSGGVDGAVNPGQGFGGDVNRTGGSGGASGTGGGGGGGGAGDDTGDGNPGGAGDVVSGGPGGAATAEGGAGGDGGSAGNSGNSGSSPGSGGGGGGTLGSGAPGQPGRLQLIYTPSVSSNNLSLVLGQGF